MAFLSFLKSLFVPLVISLILYALIFHIFLPLYRRHRQRYSQYLPLSLTANSSPNSSDFRHRVTEALQDFLPNFRLTENWRLPSRERIIDASSGDADGDEELDDAVWDGTDGRLDFQPQRPDNRRRLSRDLEEGFRDSSDDEDDKD